MIIWVVHETSDDYTAPDDTYLCFKIATTRKEIAEKACQEIVANEWNSDDNVYVGAYKDNGEDAGYFEFKNGRIVQMISETDGS